jgi:hypothetical protein
MEQIKQIFNIGKGANKIKYFNEILGIASILVALWAIFYAIPNMFITLFYTLLGNLILLLSIILIGMFHPIAALIVAAIIVVLYKISLHNASVKEGIENLGSSPDVTNSTVEPPVPSGEPSGEPSGAPELVPSGEPSGAPELVPELVPSTAPSRMTNILTSALNTVTSNVPVPIGTTPPVSVATRVETKVAPLTKPRWSKDTMDKFVQLQKSRYPTAEFNMDVIQNQATEQEVLTLIQTGFWPWSKETQDLYINAILKIQIIKIAPNEALSEAMKLYNETAAKLMMSWNTKEGQFLLMGADLGESKYDPLFAVDKNRDIIKCKEATSDKDPVSYMEKTTYLGTDYSSGIFKTKKEIVANADLPTVIPGFRFIKGACNPCGPLNITPDYGCPFKLKTKGDNSVSKIWQSLWNMK